MSEIVDRAARAMAKSAGLDFDSFPPPPNHAPSWGQRSYFQRMARAALEAIREPTEDMADEAECAEPFSFEAMWKAAIDCALASTDSASE